MIGRTAAQADRTAVAGKNDVIVNQLILQARIKQLSVKMHAIMSRICRIWSMAVFEAMPGQNIGSVEIQRKRRPLSKSPFQ